MEESKKKPVMIAIIVGCLAPAGIITYVTSRSRNPGIEVYKGQKLWVKCANENCGAAYEMDKEEYFKQEEEEKRLNSDAMGQLPITCQKCGEKSLFRAFKCDKCGEVFFYGAVGYNDFADRCPKCGYSALEAKRKADRTGR